jgi:hypothetical protein
VGDAREAIKEVALNTATGAPGAETQALVTKLEKATGCTIAELTMHSAQWPDV